MAGPPFGGPYRGRAAAAEFFRELAEPGQQDFDVAVMKTTPLTERVKLIFRWEIFNTLNTPNFANPSNNVSARSTFGTISALTVNPRIMQYALKLQFWGAPSGTFGSRGP